MDVLVFLTGLCLGSFGGMLAARLPAGEPPTGRSRCPECRHTLGLSELIPVISYVLQRGKCRHCGCRISPGYLTVELSTAVSFLLIYRCFGLGMAGILHIAVAFHLCVLAGTDMMYGLLPNKILLSMSAFVLILRLLGHVPVVGLAPVSPWSARAWASLANGFWGACIGFGLLYVVALVKPGAMGGGDVKMAGVIGFYLGLYKILPGLGLGFFLSSLYCVPMLIFGRLKKTDTIPLGIFLSFSTILIAVLT